MSSPFLARYRVFQVSRLWRYRANKLHTLRNHNRNRFALTQPRNQHLSMAQHTPGQEHSVIDDTNDSSVVSLGTLLFRASLAVSFAYCFTEYAYDITVCAGPSMEPTIHSSGEIVAIDKWSVWRYGLQDGSSIAERTQAARLRQDEWNNQHQQQKKTKNQGRQQQPKLPASQNVASVNSSTETWHEPRISVTDLEEHRKLSWLEALRHVRSPLNVGDVVVIRHPHRPGNVCKRVLGLPGDEVIQSPSEMLQRNRMRPWNESQPTTTAPQLFVVPDGHLWLEGDNSANSSDSRDYGAVPASLLVGRVVARIWPLRGQAWMRRGGPPKKSIASTTILPAGYDGQDIIKTIHTIESSAKQSKARKE